MAPPSPASAAGLVPQAARMVAKQRIEASLHMRVLRPFRVGVTRNFHRKARTFRRPCPQAFLRLASRRSTSLGFLAGYDRRLEFASPAQVQKRFSRAFRSRQARAMRSASFGPLRPIESGGPWQVSRKEVEQQVDGAVPVPDRGSAPTNHSRKPEIRRGCLAARPAPSASTEHRGDEAAGRHDVVARCPTHKLAWRLIRCRRGHQAGGLRAPIQTRSPSLRRRGCTILGSVHAPYVSR